MPFHFSAQLTYFIMSWLNRSMKSQEDADPNAASLPEFKRYQRVFELADTYFSALVLRGSNAE